MGTTGARDIGVVIPTWNGEDYLDAVLTSVLAQRYDGAVDVLVIDSGSQDATLDIVARHPSVRLHTIPNSEFGHGRTRNLGARLVNGDYVVFLTQDAVPLGDRWLSELVAPFVISDDIVAVVGRQAPRARCFPLLKYEIVGVFDSLGPRDGTTLFSAPPEVSEDEVMRLGYFSDVASAVRRDFLLDVIPYRDVPYAEDQLFGRDVIRAGLTKAYAGRAVVEHSNDLTWREYGHRIVDETVALRRIGTPVPRMSLPTALRLTLRGVAGDTLRILRDPDYRMRRRLYWLVVNPWFQLRKWLSYRAATRVDPADEAKVAAMSLELRAKAAEDAAGEPRRSDVPRG